MPALSSRTRFGYSVGSLVTGTFGTVPGLLLLPYLTDTLAVSAASAGVIVLLPKVWDVFFNPVAGRISDGGRASRGDRSRSILTGGLGVSVLFAALFAHPGFDTVAADAGYVVFIFFLCATSFAFFQVPYNALPAELTVDYDERTRLATLRIAVLAFAILLSGAGAPAIVNSFPGTAGYRLMGIAVSALIAMGTVVVYRAARCAGLHTVRDKSPRLCELFSTVRVWKPFRWLLVVYFVQSLGIGSLLAGVSYVARYILHEPDLQTVVFGCFVGPAIVVMPVWDRVGRRGGKISGFRVATAAFGIALLGLTFASVSPIAVVIGLTGLAGIGYAGVQVFPLAILPDLVTAEEERTDSTRAGVAAGVWTAAETLGLALGPGLFGVTLGLGGYISTKDSSAAQPDSAIAAITIGFSVLPSVLILSGIPLLRRKVLAQNA